VDFLEGMNLAVDYIETNLANDIDFQELAHLVECSEYHLSRIFPFVTGQGLGLYIRRRRMSQAAMELQSGDIDLLVLAVKYGYSSVDSFTRAFKEIHEASPSLIGSGQHAIRIYPKLHFSISIQGAVAMVYRIVEKDSFHIVGIMKNVPIVFSGPNKDIDAMWKTLTPELIGYWKSVSNTEPKGIISASANFSDGRMSGNGTLDHYVGVATTSVVSRDSATLEVRSGAWAVFEAVGDFPRNVQSIWGRIYSEWVPQSDFELREGPEILWNEGPDTSKPDFRSEIWIPVKRKL
jgi:AraC family transcriptional regulator